MRTIVLKENLRKGNIDCILGLKIRRNYFESKVSYTSIRGGPQLSSFSLMIILIITFQPPPTHSPYDITIFFFKRMNFYTDRHTYSIENITSFANAGGNS